MNPYSSQQNAYRKASVNTLDQHKLIIMLYEGAIKNINFAIQYINNKNIEKSHNSMVKAKNIISELMSSLNMEKGGEVAKNLKSLYAFMFSQLIEANMNKDIKPLKNIINLLKELKLAWIHIGKQKNNQNTNSQKEKSIKLKGQEKNEFK